LLDQIQSWWGKKIDKQILEQIILIYMKYSSDDKETKQIIRTVKELFVKSKNNRKQLSKQIDTYLIPQELEKKKNAEVSTPYKLRQEMLDKIPTKFWTKKQKVFEPCSGKGGFLIDIVEKFMEGLKQKYKDENERYRKIVEECLYFSDINPTNIFVNKLLLDPDNKYKLNYNEGNTLELDIEDKWGLEGFDAVIGNPPYQSSNSKGTGTGTPIWNVFVKKSLNLWLIDNGYLCFVHPAGWRKHTESGHFKNLYKIMTHENYMRYLEIHDTKDGMKNFNCGTRYDWYILQKTNIIKKTKIKNENGIIENVKLNDTIFCPNFDIEYFNNNLKYTNKNLEVLRTCNYHSYTSKKKGVISDKETTKYKYKVVHGISRNGIKYKYSINNEKNSFGISKIIIPDTLSFNGVVLDKKGEYGTTEHMLYIKINNKDDIKKMMNAFESKKFKTMLNSLVLSNFQLDYKILSLLKNDFWKEF
jgi:hypothetical protein